MLSFVSIAFISVGCLSYFTAFFSTKQNQHLTLKVLFNTPLLLDDAKETLINKPTQDSSHGMKYASGTLWSWRRDEVSGASVLNTGLINKSWWEWTAWVCLFQTLTPRSWLEFRDSCASQAASDDEELIFLSKAEFFTGNSEVWRIEKETKGKSRIRRWYSREGVPMYRQNTGLLEILVLFWKLDI